MKKLIEEAKKRVAEIAKATKNPIAGKRPAFYEGEDSYVIGHLQNGWETRTPTMLFWDNMTKKEVIQRIEEYEKDFNIYEY